MTQKTSGVRSWRNIKIIACVAIITVAAGICVWKFAFPASADPTPTVSQQEEITEIAIRDDNSIALSSGSAYRVPISLADQTLMIVRRADRAPAARSYAGNLWEPIFPVLKVMNCSFAEHCVVKIGKSEGDFEILVWSNISMKSDSERIADFLISASFGPMPSDIENFPKGSDFKNRAIAYLKNQMNLIPTLHRAYYRRMANPITIDSTQSGTVRGPCEIGSRWERAALDFYDSLAEIKILGGNQLYVNGEFRTEVSAQFLSKIPSIGSTYYICTIMTDSTSIGSPVYFSSVKPEIYGYCGYDNFPMPALTYSSLFPNNSELIHPNVILKSLELEIDGVYLLKTVGSNCKVISSSRNLYARDSAGIWYRFHPRLKLSRNTIESPKLYDDSKVDSNAQKDFVNEKGCTVLYDGNSAYYERCGSPGEVENDPVKGNQFYFRYDFSYQRMPECFDLGQIVYYPWNSLHTKRRVWVNIALLSKDQLRQRVAWALSQIFVVSTVNIFRDEESEFWIKYYDIFVRNAFGNYFDVMKEVSYSPVMASMLSFLGSRSYQRTKVKPDENYAREIMQLFTIGLWKLHKNGTRIVNSDGNVEETYNSLDIQNFARVWTGFYTRLVRGNSEMSPVINSLDTMFINPLEHDSFPKNGLDGSHIGDGYPLCKRLPKRSFLKKGAKFRFLGSSYNSPLMHVRKSLFSLHLDSELYKVLCNPQIDGKCSFKSIIALNENLNCFGGECELDTIRTVEISVNSLEKVYYEFIQFPCVELEFPDSGVTSVSNYKTQSICIDKESYRASPMCCHKSGNLNSASLNVNYFGEVSGYELAESRCSTLNKTICGSGFVLPSIPDYTRVWTNVPCNVDVQVFPDGQVSVVHYSNFSWNNPRLSELDVNSNIKFRVNWNSNSYPMVINSCDGVCKIEGNSCVCPTQVSSNTVFTNAQSVPSKSDILRELKIGAPDPSTFQDALYYVAYDNTSEGITIYVDSSKEFNSNTIFKVAFAGSDIAFLANIQSNVLIGELYRFRNPPNFMNHEEKNLKDVEYEIDAVLKHLLYHKNTAPFIADFFIKRFISSNPSPAYIETVSNAFIYGKYEGIGSGRYGDLASTIAATLLYRDAYSPVLQMDISHGKIREPVIKIIHLIRSLEIVLQKNRQIEMSRLSDLIDQEPYSAPSVFSFYLSKFQPNSIIKQAGLYAPEGQLLTLPRVISYLNTMNSLIEFGITPCFEGFGLNYKPFNCDRLRARLDDPNLFNNGYLLYNSTRVNGLNNSSALVNYFSTLLTGGRLDSARKLILMDVFKHINTSFSRAEAIKSVLELLIATPEYQITGLAKSKTSFNASIMGKNFLYSSFTPSNYRAIVYVYLSGGMDSFNLLVPHSECDSFDLFQQYQEIRTSAALPKSELLEIRVPSWGTPQPCKVFGVISKMPFLREMYNSSQAAFIANIGPLVEPITVKTFYTKKRPIALYAHDLQSQHAETLRADSFNSDGILGRIRDQLTFKKIKSASYSVHGSYSIALEESPGVSDSQFIINPYIGINMYEKNQLSKASLYNLVLNLTSNSSQNAFADTWNELVNSGLSKTSFLENVLKSANITTDFKSARNIHFTEMEYIAKVIASRSKLNSTVDVFDMRMGAFDTHGSFTEFGNNMQILDSAIEAFVKEMKIQGVWEDVVLVVASEFGRTLRSNGAGTDHAWSGNTFILGGSVKGGQILGKYPSKLNDTELDLGNGILIPTTPWEAVWNGIAQWIGITDENDLNQLLPNRINFLNSSALFSAQNLFK
jgi:cullin-associated NEDD8-dissociated protein 1